MRVEIRDLLRLLGIQATKERDVWRALCPNPEHDDHKPSWTIVDRGPFDRRTGSHRCMSCGWGGGPWELAAAVLKLATPQEGGEWIRRELRGIGSSLPSEVPQVRVVRSRATAFEMTMPSGVLIPSIDGSEWFAPAYEYLTRPLAEKGRGVPSWQLERWHVGYAVRGRLRMRVVVPVHTGGRLLSYVARAFVDGVPRYDAARRTDVGARPEAAVWGEPGFDDGDVATVTEGVFKAMAMERAGAPNPCAILGATNLGPEKIDLLSRFSVVLVATDPDRAGEKAYETLRDSLCRYADVRRVEMRVSPDDASDDENREAIGRAIVGS